jgi:hypothetical protein
MTDTPGTDPPGTGTPGTEPPATATPVTVDVTIAAPAATVWPWIRDRERLGRWHGWLADGLAEEIDYIYFDHAAETEEPYTLELELGDRLTLTEHEGATTVRITRAPRGQNPDWDAYYDDITEGWVSFLAQLRFGIERQPDRDRRTVFLATDESGPRPQDVLGLDVLGPGQRYELDTEQTPTARGETWFVASRQIGVTLDDLGPGLLVVGERPRLADRPGGGAMAILTTYGLDDARFAAVREEWTDWWHSVYPGPRT